MGAVQKLGNFLGVKKFADAMATTGRVLTGQVNKDIENQLKGAEGMGKIAFALRNEKDPAKKKQLAQLAQSMLNAGNQSATEIDPSLNLSAKEIYGSAANVVLNVATPGAFKGGKAAIIGKNAALGAGFGASSGMEKNRDLKGIAGSAVGGALTGAAIGTAGIALKSAKDFVTKTTPEWMMNKSIKPALQDLKKNVKYGSDTLGKELLEEGVKGGPKKLLEIADDKMTSLEDELQTILSSQSAQGAKIQKAKLAPYLKELAEDKAGVPGLGGDVKKIGSIFDSIPDEMTLQEANIMKRRIYKELRDVAYKIDSKLGVKAAALKQIARGLKTEIENEVGGTIVKDINKKLSVYGRLENSMVDQLAREMRNNGVGLTDAILLAGGDTTSVLALLRHLGKNFSTNAAQTLYKGRDIGSGVAGQAAKATVKRAGLNLL